MHPLTRKILAVADAMRTALRAGAEAYANGNGRARPIVAAHFTAGNQQRYGWAPLTRAYFLAKQRGIRDRRGRVPAVAKLGNGRSGVKTDPKAEFQSSTGEMVGIGSGANLPMLVRSGDMREAITTIPHPIEASKDGSEVVIHFGPGAPAYAKLHATGAGRLPKRSPVEPNELDLAEVFGVISRHMSASMGTGGKVAVSSTSVPGTARVLT